MQFIAHFFDGFYTVESDQELFSCVRVSFEKNGESQTIVGWGTGSYSEVFENLKLTQGFKEEDCTCELAPAQKADNLSKAKDFNHRLKN